MIWMVLYHHTEDAVTLTFASLHYDPADYTRDYDEFLRRRRQTLSRQPTPPPASARRGRASACRS